MLYFKRYFKNMLNGKMEDAKRKAKPFFSSPLQDKRPLPARLRKITGPLMAIMLLLCVFAVPAYATGSDPVQMIDNLKEYLFDALAAIGLILIGIGVVQVGTSFKSQDPSQRSVGLLCVFGGIIIAGVKFVVDAIGA